MHSLKYSLAGVAVLGALAAIACADNPHLGGPMKHVLVFLNNNAISVEIEDGLPDERVELIRYPGESYDGDAAVLNDRPYSGRYGWLAGHFINLPGDTAIWIEALAQSPGLATYEALSFDPIFGTAGTEALWQWSGAMTHNWYVGSRLGYFDAAYRVFVGDLQGEPLVNYTPGEITLHWQYGISGEGTVDAGRFGVGDASLDAGATRLETFNIVPAPGSGALVLAFLLAARRRR